MKQANDTLASVLRSEYTLGPGGVHGRFEPDESGAMVDVIYKPGDTIWLTAAEAAQKHMAGRITPTGKGVRVETEPVAPVQQATTAPTAPTAPAELATGEPVPAAPVAPASAAPAAPAPALSPVTEAVRKSNITDWGFVTKTPAADLVALVPDLDKGDLTAMLAAEKAGKNRSQVRNAINTQVRKLNAQAMHQASAAKRAAAKESKGAKATK